MIPERIPSKATQGEKDTFEFLKKLPDDYWVYYEPNIKNNLPDFIIIAPDLGVIIIEVKGWRIKDLRSANNNEVTVNYGDGEKVGIIRSDKRWIISGNYLISAKKILMQFSLLHHDGKYKNRFIFPFCHFVVLSNISRDNIERLEEVNLYEIFKPENTILSRSDGKSERCFSQKKYDLHW